ncbi:MAG: FAD-binding protein [Calditrichaeota bacterium]|nr:MAG: FAD-binding protein [Calditrichota bacterium]MBL1206251.1 FAD-binding protein [Calditrichota bacterium]NOG46077.1 NAD(P)-binding domain-containing protein [Calditrichota bacterium]
MENLIIWGGTIFLILVIVLPYLIKERKSRKADHARRKEAVRLGATKAVAQHPQIDSLACIGCGACVAACPEGSVLGIVSGKAVIINGLKCVGHGLCEEACPVEGLVVGLGDLSKRDDIPFMDEHFQTNITGIYIAGELGGLALIKNAINQGSKVVEHISKNIKPSSDDSIKDVLIVGAGPAGLSAALTAKKNNLSCQLLDQQGAGGTILQYPRKKLVMTKPVEIPLYGTLTKPEYFKEELLEIWEKIEEKFDIKPVVGEKLHDIKRENGHFEVTTQNGTNKAQTVVLALGRRGTPRKLNVPGEEQSKVMYKLMDAETYQNNHVLVVGGGDSAIEAAMGLARQKGNVVTLSYRKEQFFRIKTRNEERVNKMIKEKTLNVMFSSGVKEIGKTDVVINYQDKEQRIKNDYVFIFAGGEPPFGLLKKMGIQFGSDS